MLLMWHCVTDLKCKPHPWQCTAGTCHISAHRYCWQMIAVTYHQHVPDKHNAACGSSLWQQHDTALWLAVPVSVGEGVQVGWGAGVLVGLGCQVGFGPGVLVGFDCPVGWGSRDNNNSKNNNNSNSSDDDSNKNNLQALQLLVLARYLLRVPKL